MQKFNHNESKRSFLNIKIVFLFFLLISLLISSTIAQTVNNSSELENKKAELEMKNLLYEEKFFELNFWIRTLGGLLGGIAVIWTIIYGLRTISEHSKEQSSAKVSSLLESLSSESEYARLASARGLSLYIDKVTDEMLTAISIEKSNVVRNAMENALFQVKKNNMKKVIDKNSETFRNRSYLFGRLTKAEVNKEQIEARLRLSPESIKIIKERFNVDYEYGKKIQDLHMLRSLNKSNEFLFAESEMLCYQTESTGKVLARWIREGRTIDWPETGLDLSETNLYRVKLKSINANYSIFSYCIMRHSDLTGSRLDHSVFSSADLFEVCLDDVNLREANLNKCNLRKTSGKNADFSESFLNEAIFSESDYSNAKFEKATGKEVKFRGTRLRNAILNNCNITESEFQDANFEGAKLDEAKMYGSNFIKANFNNSSMKGVFLNGADLLGAKFLNANLQDADLRGANIKNADFRGANIENAKFENCKGFAEAIFDKNLN